ncbi:MAG: hypothetical protein AMJ56_15445 [Anaerolineae bacterium SG8_19]|jgi:hypothetical protein|nr:MAG: hypothetical protein AMJ56_15445 [Anaerolineae bacterium SG8_19]
MKQKTRPVISPLIGIITVTAVVVLFRPGPVQNSTAVVAESVNGGTDTTPGSNDNAAPGSCTIFTVAKDDTVFFGNNEDWIKPNTYVWSRAAPPGGYGAVFFGFDDLYPQGGVNEKGLAFDVNALPDMRLNPHPERPAAPDRFGEYVLTTNATVEEAVTTIMGLSWGHTFGGQIHLADASGDAAVIGAGVDGELAVTRKSPGPGYLVSTNFSLVAPEIGSFPCERYDRASSMLEQLMFGDQLVVDEVADILDAVHQEGVDLNTVYANAVDLTRGVIYLYHWYQFDAPIVLHVPAAIDRFIEPTPIRTLFPLETVQAADDAYRRYADRIAWARSASVIWLVLIGLSIPIQLWLASQQQQEAWHERLAWLVSTLFLGPITLAAQFLRRRKGAVGTERLGGWRQALEAALVWSTGYSFTWLLTVPYFAATGSSVDPIHLFAALYAMPLLFGLLVLRGVPYRARVGGAYGLGLRHLAVSEWTAHNLVSGGMMAVFFSLLAKWFPNGIQVDSLVWLAFGLSTLAGAMAVLPFMAWLAGRETTLWPWQVSTGGEVHPPVGLNLRAGWPALVVSFAFCVTLVLLTVSRLGV